MQLIMPFRMVFIPLLYAYIAGKLVCCFYYYKCDEFLPHENVVAHEHHSHGLIIKISATKFPQNCSYILDSVITTKVQQSQTCLRPFLGYLYTIIMYYKNLLYYVWKMFALKTQEGSTYLY